MALRHPGLSVEVVCDDAPTDLVGGGFDLAVRLGAPRDSGFIMRKIAAFDEPILASPALAQRLGPIEHPLALANAPAVCHALVQPLGAWVFQRRAEKPKGNPLAVMLTLPDGGRLVHLNLSLIHI